MTTAVFFDLDLTLLRYTESFEDIVGARRAGWEAFHVGDDGPDTAPERVESVEDAVARILD
ncbi:hypothetical protein [Haloferax sp. DFSO52]|uniref:hypothetical protein n=1 Tax=Haloferax sp. DFSO52 TaxID=3388505 RepID=UPI003A855C91